MSGIERSAKHSGIVGSVMLVLLGFVFAGIGVWGLTSARRTTVGAIFLLVGGGTVVAAGYRAVKTVRVLREAGHTDPVEVLRADMNDPGKIARDLVKLAGGWTVAGLFWAFAITTPAEAQRLLAEVARNKPELVAGWLLFNGLIVVSILFGSPRRSRVGEL